MYHHECIECKRPFELQYYDDKYDVICAHPCFPEWMGRGGSAVRRTIVLDPKKYEIVAQKA